MGFADWRARLSAGDKSLVRWIGAEVEPGRFLDGEGVARRIAPFVAAGVLPLVVVPLSGISLSDPRVVAAGVLIVAIIASALTIPWERLPAWPQAIPPLAYFVVLGLLRSADTEFPTPFDPLVAVVVAWFVLYGTRRQLAVTVAGMGVTLAFPAIIGDPISDGAELPERALIGMLLAAALGAPIQAVVYALRDTLRDSRSILQTTQEAFISMDEGGTIREWNPRAESVFGWTREQAIGRLCSELIIPERYRDAHRQGLKHFLKTGDGPALGQQLQLEGITRSGAEIPIEMSLSAVPRAHGWVFHGFLRDVTERRMAENRRQEAEERFRRSFEDSSVAMAMLDEQGRFARANLAAARLIGRDPTELSSLTLDELTVAEDIEIDSDERIDLKEGEREAYRVEKRLRRPNGTEIWVGVTHSAVRDDDSEVRYVLTQIEDISERRDMEERLSRQALHDELTGLPNRSLFGDRLQVAASRTREEGDLAVLYIDLDAFKTVNDTLGHAAGDELLTAVAERLNALLRDGDTLGRLGGDEFAILCEGVSQEEASAIADRVTDAMSAGFKTGGQTIRQTASVGVALLSRSGSDLDPEQVVADADMAMYQAKRTGKARHVVFEPSMRWSQSEGSDLEAQLRRALRDDQLTVRYQPQVDLLEGTIPVVDARLSWVHPERGLLSFAEFGFAIGDRELLASLDDWTLTTVCSRLKEWRSLEGQSELGVAMPLAGKRLSDPALAPRIAQKLSEADLAPGALGLDIDERTLLDRRGPALRSLPDLEALGVKLVIDDFGVLISSFGSVRRLPRLAALKMDSSFTAGLGPGQDSAAVAGMIGFGHGIKLLAIAKEVETQVQLDQLRELRCDRAQGPLLAAPQDADGIAPLLEAARLGELVV